MAKHCPSLYNGNMSESVSQVGVKEQTLLNITPDNIPGLDGLPSRLGARGGEQDPPAEPQQDQPEKKTLQHAELQQMIQLGEKLKPHQKDLEIAAGKYINKLGEDHLYHAFTHVSFTIKAGERIVESIDLSEFGLKNDPQAKEAIEILTSIILWWHDVIQETKPEDDFTPEQVSAVLLIDEIKQQGVDLSPEEEQLLQKAIEATEVNPDLLEQKIIQQNVDNDSLLQSIVCAADMAHFALAERNDYVKLTLLLFIEMGVLNKRDQYDWEEVSRFTLKRTHNLSEEVMQVLSEQVKYLGNYHFPEGLPKNLREKLDQKKEALRLWLAAFTGSEESSQEEI